MNGMLMTDAPLYVGTSCVFTSVSVCVRVRAGMTGTHETESRVWVPALTHPVIRLMQQKS